MGALSRLALSVLITCASSARAADLTVWVGPLESGVVPPEGIVHLTKLGPALERAAEHLSACQSCTVTLKVMGGPQSGKGGVGRWALPEVQAPGATLRVLGGYDAGFSSRAPLERPTELVISGRRSSPVFEIEGRRPALRELHFSGFAVDVAAGNSYDAKTGALFKGASSSWPILAFGNLAAERLIIADNVFQNAANGVGGPRLRPASKNAEVIVRNNLFVNNVYCWQIAGLPSTPILKRYLMEGNSFLWNHPYNPDPNTSNPGALEIGSSDAAERVELRRNLFAHNSGGAIFAQWDEKRGPRLEIIENLFFANGALFSPAGDDRGALVGKFNGSARHGSYTPAEIAEDFAWTSRGNVVLDPQIPLAQGASGAGGELGEAEQDEGGDAEVVRGAAIDAFGRRVPLRPAALPAAPAAHGYGAAPSRVFTP